MQDRAERDNQRAVVRELHGIREALEKLADDPQVEIEAGPPICANCGKMNPTISIMETEGSGAMSDFVLVAECHECQHTFYGLVESWSVYQSSAALQADLAERAEVNGQ